MGPIDQSEWDMDIDNSAAASKSKPDCDRARSQPADERTVVALGKLSEAVELLERARGRLYDFHQMLGHLDFQMSDAVHLLDECGQTEWARLIDSEIVGRNVLDGRWTFQIVEEFEDVYYDVIRDIERRVRDDLAGGQRHTFERNLKRARRSVGVPGHEWLPAGTHEAADNG